MGRGSLLSQREKLKIDAYKELNLSKREISRRLRRSVTCISTYFSKGTTYGGHFKGRKKCTTQYDDRQIIRKASNTLKTSTQLRNEIGLSCSTRTVRRRIEKCKYLRRKKLLRKPPLSDSHKCGRLNFCRKYMAHNWDQVWFSDEKKFNLDGPDGYSYYFHDIRKEEVILSRRNFGGGSVMVWGAFSSRGKSNLSITKSKIDSMAYQTILNQNFLPHYEQNDFLLADNAPVHVSASTSKWMTDKNVQKISWPSYSPDLNPMENLWGIMSRRIYGNGQQ